MCRGEFSFLEDLVMWTDIIIRKKVGVRNAQQICETWNLEYVELG